MVYLNNQWTVTWFILHIVKLSHGLSDESMHSHMVYITYC